MSASSESPRPVAEQIEHLRSKIEDDVLVQLGPQRFGATIGGFDLRSMVPGLVKLALDSALRYAGPVIESGVEAQADKLRSFISHDVLLFVAKLAKELDDPTPAPGA